MTSETNTPHDAIFDDDGTTNPFDFPVPPCEGTNSQFMMNMMLREAGKKADFLRLENLCYFHQDFENIETEKNLTKF